MREQDMTACRSLTAKISGCVLVLYTPIIKYII